MLVRVDVATSASGVLRITLSHHPSGFAPYRIGASRAHAATCHTAPMPHC